MAKNALGITDPQTLMDRIHQMKAQIQAKEPNWLVIGTISFFGLFALLVILVPDRKERATLDKPRFHGKIARLEAL